MIKKLKPYIIILVVTIALELLIFNFSSLISLTNDSINLMENAYEEVNEDGIKYYLTVDNIKIKNLYFDVELEENSPVGYSISMTDGGNYYDYYLPRGVIAKNSKASFYTNIHSYGNVKTIGVTFSNENSAYIAPFMVNGIYGNVKRPFFINIFRILLVFLILTFLYASRENGVLINIPLENDIKSVRGKRNLVITLGVILLVIAGGLFATGSHKLFNEASKPHHQQYKELAIALQNGNAYLDAPVSEGVLNAENPYDTIYLQANGIEYKADYAYFQGKYYVYFGIVPELLLYYPYHMILGKDLPNHFAVFVFYTLFVFGVFGTLRELCFRYFKDVSLITYLLTGVIISTSGTFAYIYFTADLYSVPIMAGIGLSMLGLFLWLMGDRMLKDNADNVESAMDTAVVRKVGVLVCITLGSLCMAMVAGCRPQMLLLSLLAIPVFWDSVFKDRVLLSKKSIGKSLGFILPYVVIAVIVMYYNYIRFGSVMDFGATYSLTNNDMNLRGVSISRMLLGLASFLFQLPYINGVFPFLQSVDLDYNYMGRMVIEHYYGGIMVCNLLTFSLLFIGRYKKQISEKKLWGVMGILLGSSVIIGLLDANTAGVLQRYSADMALGIFLGTAIMIFIICEKAPSIGKALLKTGFLLSLIYTFMIICNTGSGITLRYYNPELFYFFASLFRF